MSTAAKWIMGVLVSTLVVVAALAGIAFAIDPYHQFRSDGTPKWETVRFSSPGLVMNHDYDAIIIGSSMAQCFHMDAFRENLGDEPLKIAVAGMGPVLAEDMIDLAYRSNKAEKYYVTVDLQTFATDGTQAPRNSVPEYLMTGAALDQLRYLLSYEAWFRLIPVDAMLAVFHAFGIDLPASIQAKTDIDALGDWSDGAVFGEEEVLSKYSNGIDSVSDVDTAGLEDRMRKSVDQFVSTLDTSKGRHVFFFPPYSALYWCDAQEKGYFDIYMEVKAYLANRLIAIGVDVYDFQSADFIVDLNNYKDMTHYSPVINDWMVERFSDGAYLVKEASRESCTLELIERMNEFRALHPDV